MNDVKTFYKSSDWWSNINWSAMKKIVTFKFQSMHRTNQLIQNFS